MKVVKFFLILLFYFGRSHGDDELDECTQCEIRSNVIRLVRLLMAEDVNGGNLIEMVNNERQLYEMEQFYAEVAHLIRLSEFGNAAPDRIPRIERNRRLRFFSLTMNRIILETLLVAASNHYRHFFTYQFNHESDINVVHELISCENDDCLCRDNHRERSVLSVPLTLPAIRPVERRYTVFPSEGETDDLVETTLHHIIPLELISRFFNLWLSDASPELSCELNNCVHTLFGRLKRSMQKLLLISIKQSQGFLDRPRPSDQSGPSTSNSLPDNTEDILRVSSLENARTWFTGNMYVGPTYRGPFDPAFLRTRDALLETFDRNVGEIVGQERISELGWLNDRLLDYVLLSHENGPLDRLIHGFHLAVSMIIMLGQHGVTPLNRADWVRRSPTDADLSEQISSQGAREVLKQNMYWDIKKKDPRRDPRSLKLDNGQLVEPMKNKDLLVKEQWAEFVSDMMWEYLESDNSNNLLIWSCNFSRLYDDYLFRPKIPNFRPDHCSTCIEFADYLYLKISSFSDWKRCNHEENWIPKNEWCLAWRRIKTNLNVDINPLENSLRRSSQHRLGSPKWKSYSQDIGIIVELLSTKIDMSKYTINNYVDLKDLPKNILKPVVKHSSIDVVACYLTTLIPTILTRSSDCRKRFG